MWGWLGALVCLTHRMNIWNSRRLLTSWSILTLFLRLGRAGLALCNPRPSGTPAFSQDVTRVARWPVDGLLRLSEWIVTLLNSASVVLTLFKVSNLIFTLGFLNSISPPSPKWTWNIQWHSEVLWIIMLIKVSMFQVVPAAWCKSW